jgi:RHO1 GDP-GTP exchange protein 1/2
MRPVARLLRYPLLLQGVMDAAPAGHEDKETIPQVLEVIKDLGKACDGGVESAKQKVDLWRYDANLVFRTGEQIVCRFSVVQN